MIGRSKAERKVAAALRAKQALTHAWDRIDYQEETIKPALLRIRELEVTNNVELDEGDLISILTTGQLPLEAGDATDA